MKGSFLLALASILLTSCSPQTSKPTPTSPPVIPTEVIVKTGTVAFATGKVEVENAGNWSPIDTGDTVSVDSNVRTGKKSACDIQFGQLAVIHLAESTEVSLKAIGVSSQKKAVDLELLTGAVTAKVSKLLGNDRFQVKTDTVVCGVRGTRFVVTTSLGAPTTIGVAEGSVALLPPTYDAQKLDDLSSAPNHTAVVEAVRASILEVSTKVEVGSQVVVTKASLQKPAQAWAKVEDSLARLPRVAEPAVGPAPTEATVPDSVAQALQEYKKVAPSPGTPIPQPQTSATQKVLEETEDLQLKVLLPQTSSPASTGPSATVPPEPTLTKAIEPTLPAPRPIAPVGGAPIDIKKQETIRFSWKAVPGATGYEVALFRDKESSPLKNWTTEDSTVVLDRFTGLQEGTFRWEVVAVKNADPPLRSVAASSRFRIVRGAQLSAPTLDLPQQD